MNIKKTKTQAINKAVNKCINAHPRMQKNTFMNILLTQYVKGIALPDHNIL